MQNSTGCPDPTIHKIPALVLPNHLPNSKSAPDHVQYNYLPKCWFLLLLSSTLLNATSNMSGRFEWLSAVCLLLWED